VVLAGAALVHAAAVWLLPRAIVAVVRHRLVALVGPNRIHHAPLPRADWRTVPMPSPDLLYSACAYDVATRPLLVEAEVPAGYWSVSAYAANTDNFFVLDDRAVRGGRVRLVFARDGAVRDPGGGTVVATPTARGVLLFRLLVGEPGDLAALERVQRAARCEPLP
jgi:uncharacterized membrane protein